MFRTRPKLTKTDTLAARPLRLAEGEPEEIAPGKLHLKLPLRPSRIASVLFRVPKGTTKTFELDPLGAFVWANCDGHTPVRQLIRKLAKRYNLNEREAEVATISFLHTLAKKGLIGMELKKPKR